MKITLLTCSTNRSCLPFRGELSARQLAEAADAFLFRGKWSPLRATLRRAFGATRFRHLALDFSGKIRCKVTFSTSGAPQYVTLKGQPVAIAPFYASNFELYAQVIEVNAFVSATSNGRSPHDDGVSHA